MKAMLESTSRFVEIEGVPARIWEGTTERGSRILAFVTRVTPLDTDSAEFDRDLIEVRAPSPEAESFPARLAL